jgi:hypothetical protein
MTTQQKKFKKAREKAPALAKKEGITLGEAMSQLLKPNKKATTKTTIKKKGTKKKSTKNK